MKCTQGKPNDNEVIGAILGKIVKGNGYNNNGYILKQPKTSRAKKRRERDEMNCSRGNGSLRGEFPLLKMRGLFVCLVAWDSQEYQDSQIQDDPRLPGIDERQLTELWILELSYEVRCCEKTVRIYCQAVILGVPRISSLGTSRESQAKVPGISGTVLLARD